MRQILNTHKFNCCRDGGLNNNNSGWDVMVLSCDIVVDGWIIITSPSWRNSAVLLEWLVDPPSLRHLNIVNSPRVMMASISLNY